MLDHYECFTVPQDPCLSLRTFRYALNSLIDPLADALCRHHVKGLFGVTGSGLSWQLLTAMQERGMRYWGVSHEASGAVMAGAFGRQSETLGCSLSIKGPGLANMLPGMLSNRLENWPAISVSEAYGPGVSSFRMHKRVDHRALTSEIVKAYAALGDPAVTVGQLAEYAWAEIPGPVHLDLFSEDCLCFEKQPTERCPNTDQQRDLDRIRGMLDRSQRPVVIAGSLSTRHKWGSQLKDLQVPVFTTVAAKGVVNENLACAAGIFTGDGKTLAPESRVLDQADLIVGLGLRNLEVLTPKPFRAPLVLIDSIDELAATSGFAAAETLLSADSGHFGSLLEHLLTRAWGTDCVAESIARVRHYLTDDEWLPGNVFAVLQGLLPDSHCLVLDTGSFCTVAEHVWLTGTVKAFLASANGRNMGTGLPMALGAALANPGVPTVCALGDGGIRMYAGEFKLAIEQRLPVLFLFLSDGRYGSIACAPSAPGLNLHAITMTQPSWFRALEALGCQAAHVADIANLAQAVKSWNCKEPFFLEATFDPERYAAMTKDVR